MAAPSQRRSAGLVWFTSSFVVLWLMIAAGPFLWTVWGSFKVQPDFFSKADWRNALYGINTIKETGSAFTGGGITGLGLNRNSGATRSTQALWYSSLW